MSIFEFLFLDKQKLDVYLPILFEILHANMSLIAPSDNSYGDDLAIWLSLIIPAMQRTQRQIVLMYADGTLAGYFQYYINADKNSLMMEEIQIVKELQGTGLFTAFYKWFVGQLPRDIETVEAYANKKNLRSQSILRHLGLAESGENANGNSYYYKGTYVDLLNKYV